MSALRVNEGETVLAVLLSLGCHVRHWRYLGQAVSE